MSVVNVDLERLARVEISRARKSVEIHAHDHFFLKLFWSAFHAELELAGMVNEQRFVSNASIGGLYNLIFRKIAQM